MCVSVADEYEIHRLTENLWEKALNALDDEDKRNIDLSSVDRLTILQDVLTAVEEKKDICLKKRWRFKKGNREIIIRDQLEKVTRWVKKFVAVGDSLVQYDPGHAALPWAAVRFLLQVCFHCYEILAMGFLKTNALRLGFRQRWPDLWCYSRRIRTCLQANNTLRPN